MKSFFGMCFNWKVLAGLAVAAGALFVVAPGVVIGLLPVFVVAICPLSMLLMMGAGHGLATGHGHGKPAPSNPAASRESLEQRLVALREEAHHLETELGNRDQGPGGDGDRDSQASVAGVGR